MARGKSLIINFLAMTLITFIATSSASAFCDYCPPESYTDPLTGWSAQFLGVEQISSCEAVTDPIANTTNTVSPCFKFKYQITKGSSYTGVNYFAFLLPDCCTDKFYLSQAQSTPGNMKIYPVGQGLPSDYWGRDIKIGFVASITPNDTDGYMEIVATTDKIGSSAAIIRESNKINSSFKLAAPGCTEPIPTPEGLKATEEIKSIIQTASSSRQTASLTEQATPTEYQLCLKAIKNIYTKCYEAVYYSCFPPSGDCNDVPDNGWVPFVQYPKEPTLITQYSGEPACENVIRVPDNAAYSLCYDSSVDCPWPTPLPPNLPSPYSGGESCDIGADQTVSDGSFANPCYPASRCVECNFGGYPYCACW